MENIPGYDAWKTTPPEEGKPVMYCKSCGEPLYEGDSVLDVCGDVWCDECVERNRRII